MNQRKYPTNLFIIGFITNILFHFFWLFIPAIIFLIIGIFNPVCRLIGIGLLLLDIILSFFEQLRIRHTILSDSDNPNFRSFQDSVFKDGDWVKNMKDFVDSQTAKNSPRRPDEERKECDVFPSHNFDDSTIDCIKAFVKGDLPIADFMAKFHESDDIAKFLEWVVDTISSEHIPFNRRTITMKNVNQNQPFQPRSTAEEFIKEYAQSLVLLPDSWKENPPKVGEYLRKQSHLTASGAVKIYSIVADLYYQLDPDFPRTEKYSEEYSFTLHVLPGYLAGGISTEDYVSQYILPKYPSTMKKGERKNLVREEIRQAFQRDCKGYPRWIQMPEWPIGKNNKPMVYMGQKAFEEYSEYYFRDSETNEKTTVRQCW